MRVLCAGSVDDRSYVYRWRPRIENIRPGRNPQVRRSWGVVRIGSRGREKNLQPITTDRTTSIVGGTIELYQVGRRSEGPTVRNLTGIKIGGAETTRPTAREVKPMILALVT